MKLIVNHNKNNNIYETYSIAENIEMINNDFPIKNGSLLRCNIDDIVSKGTIVLLLCSKLIKTRNAINNNKFYVNELSLLHGKNVIKMIIFPNELIKIHEIFEIVS